MATRKAANFGLRNDKSRSVHYTISGAWITFLKRLTVVQIGAGYYTAAVWVGIVLYS